MCGVEDKDILDPCITVPSSVVVDRRKALNNLEDIIASAGCPPLYGRPTVEILALFIAYHKKQGKERQRSYREIAALIGEMSMWHPAIESLPEIPACPWLKQIRDLKEIEYDEELQETVQQERSGNNLIAQQLHTLYGQFLQLSVQLLSKPHCVPWISFSQIKDLLWAFAQVQSSTFHEKDGSFWAPLVHFIQHDRTQPPLYIYEEGRFVTWGWQDRLVSPGEHLRMDIGIRNPLLLYLSRGIVSSDL